MKTKQLLAGAAMAMVAALGAASAANAGLVYVGSWEVDQGPSWTIVPPAYSGQEAAALLFGGSASKYDISTVDSNPADVNFEAWVSTWGGACGGSFPCGTAVAQNFVQTETGFYQFPGDTSAYVTDWAVGSQFTNYAFMNVPEPATWATMLLGLFGVGALLRSRKTAAASIVA